MQIEFVAAPNPKEAKGAVALAVFEGALSPAAQPFDAAAGGALSAAIGPRFKGGKDQTLTVLAAGLAAERVALVGVGPKDGVDAAGVEAAAAHAYHAVKLTGAETLTIFPADASPEAAARAALGVRLAAYRFDRYRTKEPAERKPSVKTVNIVADDPAAAKDAYAPLAHLADALFFARDLVSEPANVLYPAEFAKRVKSLESLGLTVEILDEAAMAGLGMGSLLGVGQGSVRDSQLAVIQWNGAADPAAQPLAFIGKGVCFDTGGVSIKPAEGMEDMKFDMGGAAAVAGLMHVLAARKAKANVVGILGLVENMVDGNAQRPGDVVTSMSGQTIEVINTDAEGRLVLADAIWYCQDRFKPKFMVDLATLTGAMIIALGNDIAGLFSNNDELAANLMAASEATGDQLWRMPLPKPYDRQLDSPIADMKNIGTRAGGSITAALFIQRFVNDVPWAHLDIAPTAWTKTGAKPTIPEGATGFGVRLLNQLVAANYEEK